MAVTEQAAEAAINSAAWSLHLPTVRAEAGRLADDAARAGLTHRGYLAEVLAAELDSRDERRRERRIAEAHFPRIKRLAEFDLSAAPSINPASFAAICSLAWVEAGEPLVALGDPGTGKTHLLIGVGVAAAEAGKRVRYVTCAALVNELAEAADDRVLSRVVARYGRLDLLCLDELGYVHLDPRGAELLFQVLTEREEKSSIACASNAPFSEWGKTFADPRLVAAVVDRVTFRAHIVETGTNSYRLRSTRAAKAGTAKPTTTKQGETAKATKKTEEEPR
jgi:DNA replication protein DnaC